MPLIIQTQWFTREELQKNPNKLYIFGDNNYREGMGGQAKACRGEPNAVGVVTKNRPSHGHEDDYLSDNMLHNNIMRIMADFFPAVQYLRKGGTVIFPGDGIGTGLALLQEKAPLTWEFLQRYIEYVKWIGEQYEPK